MTESSTTRPAGPGTRRTPPWYTSRAPARPRPLTLFLATSTSVVALVLLVALGKALDQTVLIPPLAASMALIAGAGALPLAQPRSVIGGQLISALTGFLVLAVAGRGIWSAAVAGGLALGAMQLARASHSPAAATAVIVASTHPPFWRFTLLLAVATVILVAVGYLGNRLAKQPYPVYRW